MTRLFYAAALVAGLTLTGCEIEQTEPGRAPNVDVDVSGDPGKMPKYDVDAPDVNVHTEQKEVIVPDVDVHTEKRTIEVPNIDIVPADEDKNDN